MAAEEVVSSPCFSEEVVNNLWQFYQDNLFCDYFLICEKSHQFHVHRCVVAASSPLIANDPNQNAYEMIDIQHEIMSALIEFLYTGTLKLNSSNVWLIHAAASRLQVSKAVLLCKKYMEHLLSTAKADIPQTEASTADVHSMFDSSLCSVKLEPLYKMEIETDEAGNAAVSSVDLAEPKRETEQTDDDNEHSDVNDLDSVSDNASMQSCRTSKRNKKWKFCPKTLLKLNIDECTKIKTRKGRPKGKVGKKSKEKLKRKSQEVCHKSMKRNLVERLVSDFNDSYGLPKNKCKFCPYQFYNMSSLTYHERKHIPFWVKHRILMKCSWLTRATSDIVQITRGQDELYHCKFCDKVFKLYCSFKVHHLKNHQKSIDCSLCFETSSKVKMNKLQWKIHYQSKHHQNSFSRKLHYCCDCSKVFVHNSNLRKHMKSEHESNLSSPKTFTCRHCGKTFLVHRKYVVHLTGHGLHERDLYMELTNPAAGPVYKRQYHISKSADPADPYPYKCSICDCGFSQMLALNHHMIRSHNVKVMMRKTRKTLKERLSELQVLKFQCEECEESFPHLADLDKHMSSTHPFVLYQCKSSACKYKTKSKSKFASHVKIHNKSEDDRTCKECNRVFSKPYLYRTHMVMKHGVDDPSVRVFTCEKEGCGYRAIQRSTIIDHMNRHERKKDIECKLCGKLFKSEKNLEKHTNKIHLKVRPFICDQCGADYGEESELKTHMNRHKEKSFICKKCDYATHDKGNFQSHMYARHKMKLQEKQAVFSCPHCTYTSDRRTRLKEHLLAHGDQRPHVCEECGTAFRTKATLQSHRRFVHSERSLKCDFCDYSTSVTNQLREHVRVQHTHRDVKPYKCAYCDYHAAVSGNARKHVAQVHKGLPIKWEKVCEKYPNNSKPVMAPDGKPVFVSPYDEPNMSTEDDIDRYSGKRGASGNTASSHNEEIKPSSYNNQHEMKNLQKYGEMDVEVQVLPNQLSYSQEHLFQEPVILQGQQFEASQVYSTSMTLPNSKDLPVITSIHRNSIADWM